MKLKDEIESLRAIEIQSESKSREEGTERIERKKNRGKERTERKK